MVGVSQRSGHSVFDLTAGLRVSEVINLRKEGLLRERGLLLIRKNKGCKDRYTRLADYAIQLIDTCLSENQPKE